MLFRCSRSQTYTDYLDMPVRRFQEEMDDDSGRSESSEEDGEEEEEEEDYGSEDDDVITPLRDRESWKSFFGGWLALCMFFIGWIKFVVFKHWSKYYVSVDRLPVLRT